MSLIKVLPENLINQIAAGEVVERPSSVLKELVENSLDAGADRITVEIQEGGKKLIKISDNGKGMDREDLELSLQRHATSKISAEADLWDISTMGFRGEALASISSVSKLSIRSKTKDSISGTEINAEGGNIVNVQDCGMDTGTQVFVRQLFFNTPAREKYIKKDATELSHISSTLNTIALANPQVSFKLIHNEKVISDYPKSTDLISRVSDIFGKATAQAMIPVFYGGSEFQMDGFVGKPAIARSTSQHQYFFVNGRPIQHHVLAFTIKEAFRSMLMENKKPVFVLNIKIDPALIDVNVHPRKIEIRFEDQRTMISIIHRAVKSALEKIDLTPKGFTESTRYMSDKFPESRPAQNYGASTSSSVQNAMDFTKSFMTDRDLSGLEKEEDDGGMKTISQVSNSYIVAQNADGLVLIDQHAAHERVRYEELMDQYENEKKSIQPLLVPLQMEFSSNEAQIIGENLNVFQELGFEIENFGGNTFIVNEVPGFLAAEDLDTVVKGVLDDMINEKSPTKFQGKTEEIINYMSCRSAIKFGQALKMEEMQELVKQLEKLKRPYTCPHGRPTMISLTLSELEKMFGRK
jgi:DNA mismatch repair protein MutL